MKKVKCFLLMLIPFGLSAQDSINTTNKGWAIGLIVSPDYCYRTITSDGTVSMDNIVSSRNKNETAQSGITSGINLCYFFKKRFSIETGINYSNRGYRTKYFSDFISPVPDPFIPTRINYIYNYNFIDIPLKINFIAGRKRMRFIAGAGINTNFLLFFKEAQIAEYADGRTIISYPKPETGFNFSDLSVSLSAGTDINLTNKLNLRIEPTYRYGLGIKQTSPIKEHLWNAGLNFGFYFRF